jgi:hypothetical protein
MLLKCVNVDPQLIRLDFIRKGYSKIFCALFYKFYAPRIQAVIKF